MSTPSTTLVKNPDPNFYSNFVSIIKRLNHTTIKFKKLQLFLIVKPWSKRLIFKILDKFFIKIPYLLTYKQTLFLRPCTISRNCFPTYYVSFNSILINITRSPLKIEERLDKIEKRLEKIENISNKIEERVDTLENSFLKLEEMCWKPSGLIPKKLEKDFYNTATNLNLFYRYK